MSSDTFSGIFYQIDSVHLSKEGWIQTPSQVVKPDGEGGLELVGIKGLPQSSILDFIENRELNSAELLPYESVLAQVRQDYGSITYREAAVRHNFNRFCDCLGLGNESGFSAEKLRSLKIVDFGCGYEHQYPEEQEYGYDPWLCRILHSLGVDVCGIDLERPSLDSDGSRAEEDWKFFQADLLQEDALDNFPKNSADVVNCNLLVGYDQKLLTSPAISEWPKDVESQWYRSVEGMVFKNALRVLKPGGVLLVNNEFIYQKVGGPMIFQLKKLGERNPLDAKTYARVESYMYADNSYLNVK